MAASAPMLPTPLAWTSWKVFSELLWTHGYKAIYTPFTNQTLYMSSFIVGSVSPQNIRVRATPLYSLASYPGHKENVAWYLLHAHTSTLPYTCSKSVRTSKLYTRSIVYGKDAQIQYTGHGWCCCEHKILETWTKLQYYYNVSSPFVCWIQSVPSEECLLPNYLSYTVIWCFARACACNWYQTVFLSTAWVQGCIHFGH